MNCFELQNRCSDYLDGILSDSQKRDADEHLDQCEECNEKTKHYRTILSSIASQPRSALPTAIKKAPLAAPLAKAEFSGAAAKTRWEQIPWYLRTPLEGIGIVLLILGGISVGPKLREVYESKIEKSLSEFKEGLDVTEEMTEHMDPSVPPLQARSSALSVPPTDAISGEDDDGDDQLENAPKAKDDNITLGSSQLWRFTIKTVSPDELRPQIVKALKEVGVPQETPGLGGTQVPGGITFDLIIDWKLAGPIKESLLKLVPKSQDQTENFTWHETPLRSSHHKVPSGKSRVMIWLVQPT